MKRTEEGRFIYPAGHTFAVEKVVKNTKSEYECINITFINRHCEGWEMYKFKNWKKDNT